MLCPLISVCIVILIRISAMHYITVDFVRDYTCCIFRSDINIQKTLSLIRNILLTCCSIFSFSAGIFYIRLIGSIRETLCYDKTIDSRLGKLCCIKAEADRLGKGLYIRSGNDCCRHSIGIRLKLRSLLRTACNLCRLSGLYQDCIGSVRNRSCPLFVGRRNIRSETGINGVYCSVA